MAKDLSCPHCKKVLCPPTGLRPNGEGSLVCEHCKGIVFGGTKQAEEKVKSVVQSGVNNWQKKETLPIRIASGTMSSCGGSECFVG